MARTYVWFVVTATLLAAVLYVCVSGIRYGTPVTAWPGALFSILFTGWWIWLPKAAGMAIPGFFAFRWAKNRLHHFSHGLSLSIAAAAAALLGNIVATSVLLAYAIPPVPAWQPELLVICMAGAIPAAFLTFGPRNPSDGRGSKGLARD